MSTITCPQYIITEDARTKDVLSRAIGIKVVTERSAAPEVTQLRAIMPDGSAEPLLAPGFEWVVRAGMEPDKRGSLTIFHHDGTTTVWSKPHEFGEPDRITLLPKDTNVLLPAGIVHV